ncbi:MAG: aminotransferase class I/II-fold pyridoxal phosphate-dependent enzyme [Moraxellaceae bacterium]|nr:aminotransferase class I/II-fold pyridoxal phosphate-dependent enzyme [Moraxellaceae bacterium]
MSSPRLRLSTRAQLVEPFHVMELLARAQQLERDGRDIIHMEVGEPDFPTPAAVLAAAHAGLADGRVRYTPAAGLPALREAIAAWYEQAFGAKVAPSRIIVTAGASGALMLALALLTEPGDGWLLTDPGYPCNRELVAAFNGRPLPLHVDAGTGFQPTAALLREAWQDGVRGLVVATPANPTGAVLTPNELDALADTTAALGGTLIVDEIYQGLVYDAPAASVLARRQDCFVVNSFSKYFGMTGWRLGWLVVPEGAERQAEMLAQHYFISASTPAQLAALAAFSKDNLVDLELRRQILAERRDVLVDGLESLGLRIAARPSGAFYVWTDVSARTDDSTKLAHRLLEEAGVATTPGLDFVSREAHRYLRIAYTTDVARIAQALERISRVI